MKIFYKGNLYENEETSQNIDASTVKIRAGEVVNNLSFISSPVEKTPDDIKLLNVQMANMDLWTNVVEYLSNYTYTRESTEYLNKIPKIQAELTRDIEKLATGIALEYRQYSQNKTDSTKYRTTDDFQFRKVVNIHRHYFYFVALYNLRFINYIESKVSSGELFQKEFNSKLDDLYDPPTLININSGYLNKRSISDFNNNILDFGEWKEALDKQAEALSTFLDKNNKWDFRKLKEIYIHGFELSLKNEAGERKTIRIGILYNRKYSADIDEINEKIGDIIVNILLNLNDLKGNLIKKSLKDLSTVASDIEFGKSEIKEKLKTVNEPYSTVNDYSKMDSNFRNTNDLDREMKNMDAASRYSRSLFGKKKDK